MVRDGLSTVDCEWNLWILNTFFHDYIYQRLFYYMKICNHKQCTNPHETTFKLCPSCRKTFTEYMRQRRASRSAKKCRKGYRVCIECSHEKSDDQFMSPVYRRKKLTRRSLYCRTQRQRHDKDPRNKSGSCYKFWFDWKREQSCSDCGLKDYRVMQADHVRDKKVYIVSDYRYWAHNGGVEAMQREVDKCEPRCSFCHRLKTKARYKNTGRPLKVKPCRLRRQHQVNMKKCEIGKCKTCERVVTYENAQGFDFDHRDEEKKLISISVSLSKCENVFQRHFIEEIPKCDLLCANCHHIKTHYQ